MYTGFKKLDDILQGLKPGSLNLIGAQTAMGKTAFALNIAMHVVLEEKKKVGYFSLDMSKEQVADRILLMNNNINDPNFFENFIVDDTAFLTVSQLQNKSREMLKQNEVDLIIIDFLQLLSKNGRVTRKRKNSIKDVKILKGIKELAEELQIPIIVLTNLPWKIERRKNHKPKSNDLRRSIRSASDTVLFIYRDGYYDPDTEFKDIAEIIIAKNKYGDANKTILLGWDFIHRSFQNAYNRRFDFMIKRDYVVKKQNYELLPNDAVRTITNIISNNQGLFGIFANPGFGTTTLLMQIADQMSKTKKGTSIVLSLELSEEYWLKSMQIRDLSSCNLVVDDSPMPSMERVLETIRNVDNISVVIIDYLELMDTEVIKSLKRISDTFKIPILVAGKLTRDSGDYHPEKEPGLFAIAPIKFPERFMDISDFDLIALLHRKHDCERGIGTAHRYNVADETEIIMKVNRFGRNDRLFMKWDGTRKVFVSVDA